MLPWLFSVSKNSVILSKPGGRVEESPEQNEKPAKAVIIALGIVTEENPFRATPRKRNASQ